MPLSSSQNGTDVLRGAGMLDLLECDPRPTFILDTTAVKGPHDNQIPLVYWNPAMTTTHPGSLLDTLRGKASANGIETERSVAFSHFQGCIGLEDDKPLVYCGFSWIRVLVAGRWNVISGTLIETCKPEPRATFEDALFPRKISKSQRTTFDWTDEFPPVKMSSHVAWARSIDWASTPLGPMTSWPAQLRSIANLVMQDPRPAVVFYGADLTMIYNEAEIELLGDFHPCMGTSARVAFLSVWSEYFEPFIAQNMLGETVVKTDTVVHMVRKGFMEETYFSLTFIPIFDSEGATAGHYEPHIETTREVISQRRSRTLLQLSEEIARSHSTGEYWALATEVLSRNDKDVPFALLYSMDADGNNSASSFSRASGHDQQCTLRGSFGMPEGSPAGPAHVDLRDDVGFTPYFRQAMLARTPVTVQFDQDPRAADLVRGIQWQGFGDPCRAVAVCPLNPTSSEDHVLGFIVIGLNPRRPYDNDYLQFILVASRLLSTSLTSILLFEKDIVRGERIIDNVEAMRVELKKQLLESQKEAERNVWKFQRFAERADVGIFILALNGVYTYRNDAWFDILDPDDSEVELSGAWEALVDDEYAPIGKANFEALLETKQHQSFELRLKRAWNVSSQNFDNSLPEKQPMWVLCSVFPELTEDGEVLEIIGCITNISQQKWAETMQATQATRAQESKRQLENFIDTTSHEMRNPLSAIVQCADSIIFSHRAFEKSMDHKIIYRSILDSTVDAAETIVQCSKHMRTIVDDVLTMSKLDSGLFVMCPVDVQLESIARDAVKMFEGEAKAAGVDLEFRLEDSCKKINVDKVSLDPTRVLQILINLITNAIKFTRREQTRHISVSLAISLERPLYNADKHVQFLHTPEASEAQSLLADWEKGDIVYIIFSVQDTGCGLSEAEHQVLFNRFSQASPRTHVDYGGSGLGLFISRRFTEMHGGAVGFASKAGVGSTFSFYIKSRKSNISRQDSNTAVDLKIRTHAATLNKPFHDQKDMPPSLSAELVLDEVANSNLHILIVEDNLVNQRVLAKQLRNVGMHVAVANHGGEALDYLHTTNYWLADASANVLSLVLMDWEMPVMDGLTCVRKIRQLQLDGAVHGHVPVLAVTANARSEQVRIALEAGMDDVISKPFRIPELCQCMHKILRNTASI